MYSYVQWKYKRVLNITYPPSISGYQGTFILEHETGMNSDFSDIRFSTVTNEPISYFLESVSYFNNCRVFLVLPANESKIILHFGNGAVSSGSDPSAVFDYYNTCTMFDSASFTIESGSVTPTDGAWIVKNASTYSTITSKSIYPVDTIVEIRAHRDSGNTCYLGFRNTSTAKAAAWSGSSNGIKNDKMMTCNGSASTYTDDEVNRSGKIYYTYGVAHLAAGDKFYVNYTLRGTASTNIPGNVSLPIQIFSETAKAVYVDWIRVRKYSAVEPVITLGDREIPRTMGYLFDESTYTYTDNIAVFLMHSSHNYYTQSLPIEMKLEPFIGEPAQFSTTIPVYLSLETSEIKNYEKLRDYAFKSCDVSRSTSDAYTQLSAEFSNGVVPPELSTIKHIVSDSKYLKHTLFSGKVITKTPKLSFIGDSVSIDAADLSRNLTVQHVPWNYQVISLDDDHTRFGKWIIELLDTTHTGVIQGNIIDTSKDDQQFVFKPETTRWEAITELADYMGCIAHVKLFEKYNTSTDRIEITPALYVVPVKDIDQRYGGFDLPDPYEFSKDDITIVDEPTVQGDQDTQYNSVLVHGVLSSTGETVVAVACLPDVDNGVVWANVYTYEDNEIYEKGSTAEIEAIKRLLYFNTQKSTLQMKFIDRFDLELYQRIRFGKGFSDTLRSLTTTSQISYVVAYDPRYEADSKHIVDVSGVPTPNWLRITEVKYHSENVNDFCEIKAVTDYIYSSIDPIVPYPYNQYLAPGYFNPASDDSISSMQSIAENTVSKYQSSFETATLLSIDADSKTGVIQTASGKTMKVALPWL